MARKRAPSKKKPPRPIGVIDIETDPFLYQRTPEPFAAEFYSRTTGEEFTYWGPDCIDRLMAALEASDHDYLIYAHNGGKFDFHFFIDHLNEAQIKMIGSRIVQAGLYQHTIRDSFALIPVPLRAGGAKLDIDYQKMERHCREKHKKEILEYLHRDCVALLDLVEPTVERFGRMLTVGSIAIKEIAKLHPFIRQGKDHDAKFRPWYYGGRVECFRSGIIDGPFTVFDVNSMYPHVMRNRSHPANGAFRICSDLPSEFLHPYFAVLRCNNRGALPSIDEDGSLTFNKPSGVFHVCSHELEVALKYGLVDVLEVIECHVANEPISFGDFVDKFYREKVDAKQRGDKIGELHAKFMLNSGYGKFGQNPANFRENTLTKDATVIFEMIQGGWTLAHEPDDRSYQIYERETDEESWTYYDVAIAASITSAARAVLLEAIQTANGAIYCDTDSLICRGFRQPISDTDLGAWKREKIAGRAAIAGKKLYALYDPHDADMLAGKKPPHKLAAKGGAVTLQDMIDICNGGTIRFENMAPTFSLFRDVRFIHRNMTMTVDTGGNLSIIDDAG